MTGASAVYFGDATAPSVIVLSSTSLRVVVPAGSALRDAALLDAAAARAARGIALQDGTKPSVAKVTTGAGDAVELRWATGTLHNATRFLLVPEGYCEVTILRAGGDSDVASYFASAQARP